MKAKLILELEGKQYDLKVKDITVYIGENYITVWTDDSDSIDIKMKEKKDETK